MLVLFGASLFAASSSGAEVAGEQLEQAKKLFYRGLALLHAGRLEPALDNFQQSRKLVPSAKNTVNTAICLERLARYDEALDVYDEVLAHFAGDLEEPDRNNLGPVMDALAQRVGYLEVSSNVGGEVVVDDRPRARLPLAKSLRVLAGTRSVRVVRDGYSAYATEADVGAGVTVRIHADIQPLSASAGTEGPAVGGALPESPGSLAASKSSPTRPPGPWARPTVIAGGALAVGATGAIVITSLALSHQRDLLAANCLTRDGDECTHASQSNRAAAQAAVDGIVTFRNLRWVAIGGAALGATAVAAGVFELVTHSGKAPAVTRHMAIRVGERQWLAEWRMDF